MTPTSPSASSSLSELTRRESYQPSCGSEGADFMARWCDRCEADAAFQADPDSADGCPIVGDTMVLGPDHPDYPPEWTYDAAGKPCCTAFVRRADLGPERCDRTPDLLRALNEASHDD